MGVLSEAVGWRFPGLTSEVTGAAAKGNLARESGDGVLAEALGWRFPGLTSEATGAAVKGNLARKSGGGVLAEALVCRNAASIHFNPLAIISGCPPR